MGKYEIWQIRITSLDYYANCIRSFFHVILFCFIWDAQCGFEDTMVLCLLFSYWHAYRQHNG